MQRRTTRTGVLAGLTLVMAVLLSACGYNVPSDMTAVEVGSGPLEAKTIKGCKPPSDRGFWTNDDYAYFPTSEREWDATGQQGSDGPKFQSVTRDSVVMNIPVTIRFSLDTSCAKLTQFYVKYVRRYGAAFKNDGTYKATGASYNQQWETLLRKLVADPADATLDRIIQDYNWRKVWNDPQTKTMIEKRLNVALTGDNSLLVQTAKDRYFDGVSVLVGKPEPANPKLAQAVATEQTRVAQARAEEAQARADQAKAVAQTATARAEAKKQEAVIAGYGGIAAYLAHEAIAKGLNPYQPRYLVPSTVINGSGSGSNLGGSSGGSSTPSTPPTPDK